MRAACMAFDNRDDRFFTKQTLLDKLPPYKRMRWLEWCCNHSMVGTSGIRPQVRRDTWERARLAQQCDAASDALTVEVFCDAWALALQYSLDIGAAFLELERIRKNHG